MFEITILLVDFLILILVLDVFILFLVGGWEDFLFDVWWVAGWIWFFGGCFGKMKNISKLPVGTKSGQSW